MAAREPHGSACKKRQYPDHLDERAPTSFYWQLTLLATLGVFLFGYDTSNIGSALNFVPYNLHGLALGYLVSGASLGAAAGAILGGPASDHFGRKVLLVVDAGIYAVGAISGPDRAGAADADTGVTTLAAAARPLRRRGKAMAALGAGDVSEDDVQRAAQVVERIEGGNREQRRRAWTPGVRRALVVVCVFFIFQQITGINVPLHYGPHLLGPIFSGAHASLVQTTVAGVEVTAISLAGVMVVFAGLCALAIVFVWKFLPETKGLPVEDIVRVFERQQKQSVLSSAS